jgi:hypothetical protein
VTIAFTLGGAMDGGTPLPKGGNSTCATGMCQVGLDIANSQIQTALCHAAHPDCDGLSGTIFNMSLSFDGCCFRPSDPSFQFCAPTQYAGTVGVTCQ